MVSRKTLHINCDLGEGMPNEAQIMPYIQACNLACGGHYGDTNTLTQSMRQALNYQLECGAHPAYPDPQNFGRITMKIKKAPFIRHITAQLERFKRVQLSLGMGSTFSHIKAHGALYQDLCLNKNLVLWYAEALERFKFKTLYTPAHGALYQWATENNIAIKREVFLDRRYTAAGQLAPRTQKGSVITEDQEVWNQLKNHLNYGTLIALTGEKISLTANTYCLHGDHPNTAQRLALITTKLQP